MLFDLDVQQVLGYPSLPDDMVLYFYPLKLSKSCQIADENNFINYVSPTPDWRGGHIVFGSVVCIVVIVIVVVCVIPCEHDNF